MSQQPRQDSDNGWHPLWKWVGIGCSIIVLISAAALTFGAWKFATCCGDLIDLGKRTAQARQLAQTFSTNIQNGRYESAWQLTSSAYRDEHTAEGFRQTFAEHRDITETPSSPIVRSIDPDQSPAEKKVTSWTATVFFAQPSGRQALEVIVGVKQFGSGKEKHFRVDGLKLNRVRRTLSDEPPARRITGFKRRIGTGSEEILYRMMTEAYRQKYDKKRFKEQLRSIRQLEQAGGRFEFKSILYEKPEVAVVEQTVRKVGKSIKWELRGAWNGDWQIHSFEVVESE